MRAIFHWNLGTRTIELGRRTLIMGVVNVTPDSFSDGGLYFDAEKAGARAQQLLDEGATFIDIGGESTRPGAGVESQGEASKEASGAEPKVNPAVSEEEERKRVLPVIRDLTKRRPDAIISVDTYKAGVARAAVEAGGEIVNDVSGFRWDPKMAKTVAELKIGAVLMHTRGRPEEWRSLPPIGDPVLVVKRDLRQWAETAILAGIKRDHLALDPGFGFGKRFEENYPLLARFAELQQMGYPLVAGTSRKSFIGRALARDGKDAPVEQRLYGALATEVALILKGAHIIRTHDVRSAAEAARIADAIVANGG
jgi:dihydropteroate synthase